MANEVTKRSRTAANAVLVATLVLASPFAAHAQAAQGQALDRAEAGRAAGKVAARLPIDIAEKPLAIGTRQEVTYDSNVAHGPLTTAQRRDLEKAEFIVTPSATIDYAHAGARNGVAISGVFGYDFHEKNRMLNRERIDLSALSTALIGSACSVTAKLTYLRKQTRQQDLTLIVVDNTVKLHVATLAQSCVTAGGLIGTVQLLDSGWHNSSPLNINNDRRAASGLFGYTDAAFGTTGITLQYERTDFFGRPAVLIMTPDTLEKTAVGLQHTSPTAGRLSWSASAAYVRSVARVSPGSRLEGKRRRQGVVGQVELAYRLNNRLRLTALAARRIRHDTSFTITTDAQLAADITLTPRIKAGIGARWLRDCYYGRDTTLPQIYQDRQDQASLYGSVSGRIGTGTLLIVDVRRDWGRASFAPFDYNGTRVTLTLATTLENPFARR